MRKTEQVFWGRCELLESRAVMGIAERGDAAERNSLGGTGSFLLAGPSLLEGPRGRRILANGTGRGGGEGVITAVKTHQ